MVTYTNTSDQAIHVPNLGNLEPGETSVPTELELENPILKKREVKKEEIKEAQEEEPKVLRGIDRTSKKDQDEVKK